MFSKRGWGGTGTDNDHNIRRKGRSKSRWEKLNEGALRLRRKKKEQREHVQYSYIRRGDGELLEMKILQNNNMEESKMGRAKEEKGGFLLNTPPIVSVQKFRGLKKC